MAVCAGVTDESKFAQTYRCPEAAEMIQWEAYIDRAVTSVGAP